MALRKFTDVEGETVGKLIEFIDSDENLIDYDPDAVNPDTPSLEVNGERFSCLRVVDFHKKGGVTNHSSHAGGKRKTVCTILLEIPTTYKLLNPKTKTPGIKFGSVVRQVPRFFVRQVSEILNSDWADIPVPRKPK